MVGDKIRKFILPTGYLLSLVLIGILLLSALLYYRAVKIQRFLEPALAIVQPRNEFAQNINRLLADEFGAEKIKGIKFSTGSIVIEESLLFDSNGMMKKSAYAILKRLGHVFISVLDDRRTAPYVDLILVSTRFPSEPENRLSTDIRMKMQRKAELILYALFKTEPRLDKDYGGYFAATSLPLGRLNRGKVKIELMIIPTELLHIEALQRLGKYAD